VQTNKSDYNQLSGVFRTFGLLKMHKKPVVCRTIRNALLQVRRCWRKLTTYFLIAFCGSLSHIINKFLCKADDYLHNKNAVYCQLSLAIPPWVGAISTSAGRDVNRHAAMH